MKNNIKKINLIIISIIFLLCPVLAFAQNPSTDSAGNEITDDSIFVKLQVPLPFVATKCETPSGDGAVCSLSDYIAGMYRLLIGVGALFAVVMIIIAGYQWMFAGGSSDKTGAAKKRLLGAVIGLMLALLSYIILNAITPRLVSLRMPKVDPVQRLEFKIGETCANSPELKTLEENGLWLVLREKRIVRNESTSIPFEQGREFAYCGKKYDVYAGEVEGGPSEKVYECSGGYCDSNEICIINRCLDAVMHGTITRPGINIIPFSDRYVESIKLIRYCRRQNGGLFSIEASERSFRGKPDFYTIPRPDNFEEEFCRSENSTSLGYYLKIDVNDDLLEWDDTFYTGNDCIPKGYSGDVVSKLITFEDLNNNVGFECDIDLTDAMYESHD